MRLSSPTAHLFCALALGGAACAEPAPTAPPPANVDRDDLVRLRLVADRPYVAGEGLRLAAHYTIAPGWHIYWENPGDAGLETKAELAAPPGFLVVGPSYPVPARLISPGDVTTFGYEGEAALLFTAQAAEGAAVAAPELTVTSTWLVCADVCIRGRGVASLDLGAAGQSIDRALVDRWTARLPRPWSELSGAKARWQAPGELVLEVPGGVTEVFPGADPVAIEQQVEQKVDGGAEASSLRLKYRAPTRPGPVTGVVGVSHGGRVDYYAWAQTWPGL